MLIRKFALLVVTLVATSSPALCQGGGAGGASSGGTGGAGSSSGGTAPAPGGRSGSPVATPANPTFSGQSVPPATSTTNPAQNSLQSTGVNSTAGYNSGISSSNANTNGTASPPSGASTNNTATNAGAPVNMSAAAKAVSGVNTLPPSEAPGAVSAPGVGVGHSANGLPIGAPGSGPGSPEQPIGAGK